MHIRPAVSADLDACFNLDAALNESRPEAEREGFLISGDEREKYGIYRSLGCFYVAEAEGGVIGFAFALPPGTPHFEAVRSQRAGFQMTEPEVWDTPELGWMGKVAVRPEYMRRGTGRALYNEIFSKHPAWSFLTTTVSKPIANLPSECFHRAFEFVEVGEALLGDRGALKNVTCKVHFRRARG